jgi:hypothetical protein
MSQPAKPMIGRRFGLLTVVSHAGRNHANQLLFECRCDCGAWVIRLGYTIRHSAKVGNTPSCGRHRTARRGGETTEPKRKGKVTIANYKRIAKDFNPAQVSRLADVLKRHPRAVCHFCSRGRACHVAAEAVEFVHLEEKYGLAEPFEESYHRIDYRKAGMYTQ